MHSRRWLLALALLAGGLGAGGGACGGDGAPPAATPSPPTASPATPASADPRVVGSVGALTGAAFADQPGCSAAVGKDGTVVWAGARGLADLRTGAPLTTATVFDFASVSKQFTAAAVLLLADEGRLSTADPVARHVTGLPGWAARVTIDQLIHHTSGIPDYTRLLARQAALTKPVDQRRALAELARVRRLEFPPGNRFRYSNSNYVLLAEAVRARSGAPLPRFLDERIFGPLGLDLAVPPAGTLPAKATSYRRDDEGGGPQPARWPWTSLGDGAVHGTPSELVRWADNYRTGKAGGRALLKAQLAGAVAMDQPPGARYAGGIMIDRDGRLWHQGLWEGFVSSFEVSADRRTAVAVACNSAEHTPSAISAQLMRTWSA